MSARKNLNIFQVVAGIKYTVDILYGETECMKNQARKKSIKINKFK